MMLTVVADYKTMPGCGWHALFWLCPAPRSDGKLKPDEKEQKKAILWVPHSYPDKYPYASFLCRGGRVLGSPSLIHHTDAGCYWDMCSHSKCSIYTVEGVRGTAPPDLEVWGGRESRAQTKGKPAVWVFFVGLFLFFVFPLPSIAVTTEDLNAV